MLSFAIALLLAIVTVWPLVGPASAEDTYVHGYTRKDGTYVQPHYRSAPDGDRTNNWSTRGNQNKHTGQWGTRSPDSSGSGLYGTQQNPSGLNTSPYQRQR